MGESDRTSHQAEFQERLQTGDRHREANEMEHARAEYLQALAYAETHLGEESPEVDRACLALASLHSALDEPAEELAALTATSAVRQGLEQRKREELHTLLQRIETDYQRLGKEQGFRLLMQKGEKEPAYVLVAGSKPADCKGEVDLTAQIIAAIDAPPLKP